MSTVSVRRAADARYADALHAFVSVQLAHGMTPWPYSSSESGASAYKQCTAAAGGAHACVHVCSTQPVRAHRGAGRMLDPARAHAGSA